MRVHLTWFVFLIGVLDASSSNKCSAVQELAGKCKPRPGVTIKKKLNDNVDLRINVTQDDRLSYIISDTKDKWAEYHELPVPEKSDDLKIDEKIHDQSIGKLLITEIERAQNLAKLSK